MRSTRLLKMGQYSRMLDLGGSPHASTSVNRSVLNAGNKNSKLQIIAFDFNLLTKSVVQSQEDKKENMNKTAQLTSEASKVSNSSLIRPDMSMVQNVANLLNFDLKSGEKKKSESNDDDDLSKLTGRLENRNNQTALDENRKDKGLQDYLSNAIGKAIGSGDNGNKNNSSSNVVGKDEDSSSSSNSSGTSNTSTNSGVVSPSSSSSSSPVSDVRSKYAAKLRKKLDSGGSIAGIDLAKAEKEEGPGTKGDAAGHLAYRAHAIATGESSASGGRTLKGSRWIVKTGTGNLLSYITNRSMKIVLLPIPGSGSNSTGTCNNYIEREEECQRMDDFVSQLKQHVIFDVVIKNMVGNYNAKQIINNVMLKDDKIAMKENQSSSISTNNVNNKIMIVSDRDDYIKIGKENGFITCRLKRKNKFNGNITANYSVEDISELQEVINEINGISYNALNS